MVVVKLLAFIAICILFVYAVVGALFIHGVKYDYESKIVKCGKIERPE